MLIGSDGYSMPEKSTTQQLMTAVSTTAHSMTGDLFRVMVCSPRSAGWHRADKAVSWRDLGFHHPPAFAAAQAQHETLCRLLADAGAEVDHLPPSDALTLDAVSTHDASLP